jgi:hypothetical protein
MSFSFVDGDSLNPQLNWCYAGKGCNSMYFGNVGEGDYMIFDFKSPKRIETIKFKSLGLSYETQGSSDIILGYNTYNGNNRND